jgi:hypothetical protein
MHISMELFQRRTPWYSWFEECSWDPHFGWPAHGSIRSLHVSIRSVHVSISSVPGLNQLSKMSDVLKLKVSFMKESKLNVRDLMSLEEDP